MTTMAPSASGSAARLAKDGTLTGLGSVVAALAGFVFTVVAGRMLGPAGAGVVFVLTSLFTIVTTILKLGTDTTLVRLAARLQALGHLHRLARAVVVLLVPVLLVACVVAAVVALGADGVAARVLDLSKTDPDASEAALAVVVLALLIPAQTLTVPLLALLRGLGDIRPLVLVDQMMKPLGRVALAGVAAIAIPTALGVTIAWVTPVAIGFLVATALAVSRLRSLRGPISSAPAHDEGTAVASLWSYSAPRAAAQTIEILTLSLGVVLVGRLAGAEQAGLYAAVNRLALAGTLAWQAVRLVIAPQLAGLLASDRRGDVQDLHQTASGWVTVASWPFYLLLAGLATPVLMLFGPGFEQAAPVLVVVAAGMLVPTLVGPAQTIALMAGWSAMGLAVSIAALMTNVGLLILLVPQLGALGAAIGWAAALTVEAGLYAAIIRLRLRVSTIGRPALLAAAISTATVGVPMAVAQALNLSGGVLLLVALVAAVVYVACVVLLRRPLSLDEVIAVLKPRPRRRQAADASDREETHD